MKLSAVTGNKITTAAGPEITAKLRIRLLLLLLVMRYLPKPGIRLVLLLVLRLLLKLGIRLVMLLVLVGFHQDSSGRD
jgi:hypothetical protein